MKVKINFPLKNSKDIQVGQFYQALGAAGYYYVGIWFGDKKRLVCINMTENEIKNDSDISNPLFPDEKYMYQAWQFVPVLQDVIKNLV